MTTAFPRGGSLKVSKSSGLNKVDESLFSVLAKPQKNPVATKSKKKKSKKVVEEPVKKSKKTITVSHKLVGNNITPDTISIGVVTEVFPTYATVSLPDSISGRIQLDDLSDEHMLGKDGIELDVSAYLTLGQIVVVAGIEPSSAEKKYVRLSPAASKVNTRAAVKSLSVGSIAYGTVESVEDHGYQINIGHSELGHGFLSFETGGGDLENPAYKIGQVIQASVKSFTVPEKGKKQSGKRIFQLDNTAESLDTTETKNALALDALRPGMKVAAKVKYYLQDGVAVRFQEIFNGTISSRHLEDRGSSFPADSAAERKYDIEASILFIDYENKVVALSSANWIVERTEEIVNKDQSIFKTVIGKVFIDSVVEKVERGRGVLLSMKIKDNSETLYGFASKSLLIKEGEFKDGEFEKKFKVGQKCPCRVVGYSAVESLLKVSVAKDTLEASVLSAEEIEIGKRYKVEVSRITDNGLVLSFSKLLSGFVHSSQLSDVMISDPSSRFKIGQKVDARVLNKEEGDKNRVFLTLKRTLLDSKLPCISSYEVEPGTVAHGYVCASDDSKGVLVRFYGNVIGQIQRQDFGVLGISNLAESYPVGKAVKVKVVSTVPEKRLMRVTLRIVTDNDGVDLTAEDAGTLVSGKVLESGVLLLVKLTSGAIVTIPKYHLADDPSLCADIVKRYKKGSKVTGAMVLNPSEGLATLKPVLIAGKEKSMVPFTFESVTVGSVVVGYVSHVSSMLGVFVTFGNGISGLAPRANVAEGFVADPNEYFKKGQSVIALVSDINFETKRIILTLRPSAVEIPGEIHACFLKEKILHHIGTPGEQEKLPVGKVVEATIVASLEYGYKLELENGWNGFCALQHTPRGFEGAVGKKVSCRVLDNSSRSIVDVSLRPTLVEAGTITEKEMSKSLKKASKKTHVVAIVELVKDGYCVLSLPSFNSIIVAAPTSTLNGRISGIPSLEIDSRCDVRVLSLPLVNGLGVAEFQFENQLIQSAQRKRARSRGASIDLGNDRMAKGPRRDVAIGDTVEAKVFRLDGVRLNMLLMNVGSVGGLKGKFFGKLHVSQIKSDFASLLGKNENPLNEMSIGDIVQCTVTHVKEKVKKDGTFKVDVSLSMVPKNEGLPLRPDDLVVGKVYTAFVSEVVGSGLVVALSPSVHGFVFCGEVSRDLSLLDEVFNQKKTDKFVLGSVVAVRVLHVGSDGVFLSMLEV